LGFAPLANGFALGMGLAAVFGFAGMVVFGLGRLLRNALAVAPDGHAVGIGVWAAFEARVFAQAAGNSVHFSFLLGTWFLIVFFAGQQFADLF
jgi:hypothetical protein